MRRGSRKGLGPQGVAMGPLPVPVASVLVLSVYAYRSTGSAPGHCWRHPAAHVPFPQRPIRRADLSHRNNRLFLHLDPGDVRPTRSRTCAFSGQAVATTVHSDPATALRRGNG